MCIELCHNFNVLSVQWAATHVSALMATLSESLVGTCFLLAGGGPRSSQRLAPRALPLFAHRGPASWSQRSAGL